MIIELMQLLQQAEPGISPEVDRALGKHELPLTWPKILKHINRWLKK